MSASWLSAWEKLGFNKNPIVSACGTTSRNNPSRFGSISLVMLVIPLALPPGRLMLAVRPYLTGSLPMANTIGMLEVAAFAASADAAGRCDDGCRQPHQFVRHRRQLVVLAEREAIFD